ncbi:hypothetical protein [Larkinella soli]|uniref:hypothetical protein n=1 Tax=Larkinella soli TaxID=1770527 RepID=UPI000FFBC8FF|nr:hypothetical protein [Larkinella soli]
MSNINQLSSSLSRLALLFIILMLISCLFPIVGSIVNQAGKVMPTAGIVDVSLALAFLLLFIALKRHPPADQLGQSSLDKARKVSEYLSALPLMLIGLYLLNLTINWNILLIGLGWRFWLAIQALPYLICAFEKKAKNAPINQSDR